MRVSAALVLAGLAACVEKQVCPPAPSCGEDAAAPTLVDAGRDAEADAGEVLGRIETKRGTLVVTTDERNVVAHWRSARGTVDTTVDYSVEPGSLRLGDVTGDELPDVVYATPGSAPLGERIHVLSHEREEGHLADDPYTWRYVLGAKTVDEAVTKLSALEHARCTPYEAFMAVQVHRGDVLRFTRKGYEGSWQRDPKPWHHNARPYAPPRNGNEVYVPDLGCNPTNDACTFTLRSGDTTIPFTDVAYFLERKNGFCVVESVAMTTD